MAKYKVLADVHKEYQFNERRQIIGERTLGKGDVVEMDPADAERLVKTGGLAPHDEADEAPEGQGDGSGEGGGADDDTVPDGQDYDNTDEWSYGDLQVECKERGLTANGSREELIARLRENDLANAAR